jgi:hypothetical protein
MPPTAPPEFLRYSPADIIKMGRERGTAPEQIAQAVTKHRDNLTAYGMQTYGERFSEALPRLQQETNTALEELKPGFGVGDTLSGIGSMLGGLPTTVPAAYYGVTEGFTRPDQYSPEARAAFDANAAYQQRMQQESQQRLERGEATSTGDAFRSAGPSLGGTVGSMAAAIPAGMAAGALVGTAIEPVGGTAAGGLVGAAASGLAAAAGAGTVAYRMAGQQFLDDAFKALQKQRGGQMSEAEMQQAYNELLPLAENSALWEAGPEAIGNAVSLGTAKIVFGLGKPLLTNLAKTALGKVGVKVGAIAGSQAVELGGETTTALGQGVTQAQADAYARGDANWRQARSAYDRPGGTLQALKDIAPATLALGATTLGAGGVVKLATLPFQKPNDSLPPNQTPAPTGAPQTPGATPGAAPLAGAAGPLPSTLSRIAQESLVPDLPEDTGELTADEVQDLQQVDGGGLMVDGQNPAAPAPLQEPSTINEQAPTLPPATPTAPAGAGTGAMVAEQPVAAPPNELLTPELETLPPPPTPQIDTPAQTDAQPVVPELLTPAQLQSYGQEQDVTNAQARLDAAMAAQDRGAAELAMMTLTGAKAGSGPLATRAVRAQDEAVTLAILSARPVNAVAMERWAQYPATNAIGPDGNIPRRGIPAEYAKQGDVYVHSQAAQAQDVGKTQGGGFKNLNVSGRTAGFLNTDILNEATDLLRSGITDFANWSRAMVSRFGRAIQEFLAGIWQQVTSPQTNAAQNVRMGRAQGTAPVTLGNSGAALDASKFQLISAGTGQDSAAGLFQYENRNEASLNQGEREALDALRREYPGESITPVSIRDVRRSPDGATRGASRDSALADWSRSFLKVFGKNILWIDAVGKNSQYLNGGNPTTQRNILVVNANSREPILYTLGHELTHALKAQNSTIYRELEREILANGTNLEAYRERLRNAGYTEEQINDELIADFVGSQMLEPDFLNRLADAKPTLFARFARAVVRFLNQLLTKVSKLQRDVRPYFEAKIIPLRDTLAAALKEYAASGQFPDNPLSEPKPGVQMSQALNPFTPSDAPSWMRTLFKVPSVGAFRVQNLSVRKLLTGSALPTAMADIVTASDRDKKSIEYAAAALANDLEQAMQAHSAATGQTQQQVNDLVSNVLQGALPLTIVLNPELRTAIRRARNLLDSLSTAVAGATSGQMGSTILANLGSWMRRSYAAFDPAAGWSFDELTKAAAKGRKVAGEPAAKILNDARRYLRSQTPGLTLGELEAQMRQLMDRNLWEEALIGSGAGVRKDVSSLMKRKDIAPEIRALMGEERNPVKKLIGSAKWQAQFVAKHENQQKIRDVGLQLGMFSPSQTGRFTEELGEDRSTSGFALNGKKIYTTPELRRALSQTTGVLATDDLGSNFLKMIYWLGGQAKLNKVALNPDSWVVNLLGNFTGLAMTGGLSPFAPLRLYQNSRKAIELLRSGKKQAAAGTQQQVQNDLMRQMMAKLTAAGVADSSMNAQLVEDALNKNLIQFIERHDVWNGAVGAVKLAVVGQALAKPFGAAGRAVGGVVGGVAGYTIGNERVQNVQEAIAKWTMQNPDRFGKIVEFLDNQTTLMAAGMTPDAAFAKATQKTLNTMPDYSKLPAVLRQFSRLGVVGSFIAFQWEVYRNSFHNLKYIAEELGSGNPALMEKGARRLLGMGAVYALALGGLQAILGGAAGDDEKDEAYRRALAKPWEKYSRLAYTQLDTEKASFYNTSYLLPQVTLTEILRAAAEGKDFAQALEQAGGVLQKQFAETGIHADPLLALLFNFDKGGQKATTEEGWRATLERLGEILAPMTPGAADKFERLLRSKEVLNAPRWDREFSVAEEMKRLFGIRQATYAHDRRIAGRLSEFNSRKRDITTTAAQVYGEAGKARADVWGRQAQQQAADRATERLNALKAEYDQFVQDLGTLGFKPTQIERFRKDAGTSPNWKPYGITPEGIKQP